MVVWGRGGVVWRRGFASKKGDVCGTACGARGISSWDSFAAFRGTRVPPPRDGRGKGEGEEAQSQGDGKKLTEAEAWRCMLLVVHGSARVVLVVLHRAKGVLHRAKGVLHRAKAFAFAAGLPGPFPRSAGRLQANCSSAPRAHAAVTGCAAQLSQAVAGCAAQLSQAARAALVSSRAHSCRRLLRAWLSQAVVGCRTLLRARL
eukprot:356135-Chlamydomonas_euryale.AAC.1